jgi:hypothetical protein
MRDDTHNAALRESFPSSQENPTIDLSQWVKPPSCSSQGRIRWLYCMTEARGEPVKLGVTQSLATRRSMIQGHTWRPVHIVWAVRGAVVHELALKRLLKPRVFRFEWFTDADDMLKDVGVGFPDPEHDQDTKAICAIVRRIAEAFA